VPEGKGEVKSRIGMSGAEDVYLVNRWEEYLPGFGVIERAKTTKCLHISMSGKLNEGLYVHRGNWHGIFQWYHDHEEDVEPEEIRAYIDNIVEVEKKAPKEIIRIGCKKAEVYNDGILCEGFFYRWGVRFENDEITDYRINTIREDLATVGIELLEEDGGWIVRRKEGGEGNG
jgi:hypothetical protein